MNWKCKAVMFLTLLIFCVGSVCAADADPFVKKLIDDNNQLNNKVYNQSIEIKNLAERLDKKDVEIHQLNNTVKELKDSNKQLVDSNNQKDIDIKELKDFNNQLNNTVKQLVDSNNQRDKRIEALELEIKELKETNKVKFGKKKK